MKHLVRIGLLIAIGAIIFVSLTNQNKSSSQAEEPKEITSIPEERQQLKNSEEVELDEFSYVADILSEHGNQSLTPLDDVRLVHTAALRFAQYNRAINSIYFSENADLTQLLLGKKLGLKAQLTEDHPLLGKDEKGDLVMVDRWGSAYVFHLVGGRTIDVRSAGPDRRLYSSDDILLP